MARFRERGHPALTPKDLRLYGRQEDFGGALLIMDFTATAEVVSGDLK